MSGPQSWHGVSASRPGEPLTLPGGALAWVRDTPLGARLGPCTLSLLCEPLASGQGKSDGQSQPPPQQDRHARPQATPAARPVAAGAVAAKLGSASNGLDSASKSGEAEHHDAGHSSARWRRCSAWKEVEDLLVERPGARATKRADAHGVTRWFVGLRSAAHCSTAEAPSSIEGACSPSGTSASRSSTSASRSGSCSHEERHIGVEERLLFPEEERHIGVEERLLSSPRSGTSTWRRRRFGPGAGRRNAETQGNRRDAKKIFFVFLRLCAPCAFERQIRGRINAARSRVLARGPQAWAGKSRLHRGAGASVVSVPL